MCPVERRRHRLLVVRVAVGVEQADGHRVEAGGERRGPTERRDLFPLGVQAAGDLEAEVARHQRLGAVRPRVVQRWPGLAGDLDHVPVPFGGDQGYPPAPALEQGIGRHRGPVGQDVRPPDLAYGLGYRLAGVPGRRRRACGFRRWR